MLKALELSGFKSFADKTRFDFPAGITVVVGPNGSGKSNIVDAIKWVLGEQSAKSLRGKDMSDVIFKGSSGANARKPANSASATIILDNADGRLLHDAAEIHVTRRVYRSGESEYLINNEPCRLKDIRQLFRGTGVGVDAYSLIEQGKVERLLQASPKDRRAIFEEAAGISRFKAQKVEAERRLERVHANLTRLADIVEEVGNRYRSVKNQASKAARYKELTDRLQQLRTFVGAKDFRQLSERIAAAHLDWQTQLTRSQELQTGLVERETQHRAAEQTVDALTDQATGVQAEIQTIREQLAERDSQTQVAQQRLADLLSRRGVLEASQTKAAARQQELAEILHRAEQETELYQTERDSAQTQWEQLEQEIQATSAHLAEWTRELEGLTLKRDELELQLRQLQSERNQLATQLEIWQQSQAKLTSEIERWQTAWKEATAARDQNQSALQDCQHQAESSDSALALARQSVDGLTARLADLQQQIGEAKSQEAGVTQRAKLLEELEKKQEGVSSGAQQLLRESRQNSATGARVLGLVADLIQVNVKYAPLVDAALGERAQFVVVADDHLERELAWGERTVSGRVGILSLQMPFSNPRAAGPDVQTDPAVLGALDQLLEVSEPYREFFAHLFANTWLVRDLKEALRIHHQIGGGQLRLVTLSGEVVEPNGTLMVGPKSKMDGLVSRRSELRALAGQAETVRGEIRQFESLLSTVKSELKAGNATVQRLINENQTLSKDLAKLQAEGASLARDQQIVKANWDGTKSELSRVQEEMAQAQSQLEKLDRNLAQVSRDLNVCQERLAAGERSGETARETRREREKQATAVQVQLAKLDQQLADGKQRSEDYRRQLAEQSATAEQAQQELLTVVTGIGECELTVASASQAVAELNVNRESLTNEYNRLQTERLAADRQRKQWLVELSQTREQLKTAEDSATELSFRVRQMESEKVQLAERLRDDYGIDVAALEEPETAEETENREQIDQEISELRQKIGAMGAVNMQALAELEELENRYQTLDKQYQDLVEARDALLRIIQKINNDSRRLFVETLEAIRTNFQKLFRQTFGGGQADIVLEEGVDVLEGGVDIIATPPGKPKFSNSLLSGGEKALTAVSLLMAIFQFRPSPFCVLDEVDAPFDEANVGRFIDVLKSFLGWTKFVIVTHSKKTMTAATTLYGITMQESGISKRVSVRFEDVSDDGQISKEAVKRSEQEAPETHPTT